MYNVIGRITFVCMHMSYQRLQLGLDLFGFCIYDKDVWGAVPSRVAHLMSQGRAFGIISEVDQEVIVDRQTSLLGVNVELKEHRPSAVRIQDS